jgi:hypothetical protein
MSVDQTQMFEESHLCILLSESIKAHVIIELRRNSRADEGVAVDLIDNENSFDAFAIAVEMF